MYSPGGAESLDISNLSISQTPRADPKINRHSLGFLSSQKSMNKLNLSKVSQFMYEDITSQRHNNNNNNNNEDFSAGSSEVFYSPF